MSDETKKKPFIIVTCITCDKKVTDDNGEEKVVLDGVADTSDTAVFLEDPIKQNGDRSTYHATLLDS